MHCTGMECLLSRHMLDKLRSHLVVALALAPVLAIEADNSV
jgi:hypothetical protein